MKSTAILDLMVKDHDKLFDLIHKIKNTFRQDKNKTKEWFEHLEWNLEKHIFIEEKAIFTSYKKNITDGDMEIQQLLKEHNIILDKIMEMHDEILKKGKCSFGDFLSILKNKKDNTYKLFLNKYGDSIYSNFWIEDKDVLNKKGIYVH